MRAGLAAGAGPATGGTDKSAGAIRLGGSTSNTSLTSGGTTAATLPSHTSAGVARCQDEATIGDMQSPLEDANFGKSIDQVVVMSAADMVTFSRPNDSDPTTKMATLCTNRSAAATCGRKAGPTSVDDEPRHMWEHKQAMAEPLAPLSAAHLPQRAPESEHAPMDFGQPLAGQYLGSKAALARSEKVEETDKYVEEALTGLVVAGASKEEFLKIQRQQLSGIESAR